MAWFSFPLFAVRTYITLGGAAIKSILRISHRDGAEVEQMAAGPDDELNQANWFIGWSDTIQSASRQHGGNTDGRR